MIEKKENIDSIWNDVIVKMNIIINIITNANSFQSRLLAILYIP